jgi:integrase
VRKSLTQVSHTKRAAASHLTRKDGIYYYRRRLPDHLGTDVALSLGTRNFREAEHLAEAIDLTYRRAVNSVTSPADLRTILRAYLESALEDDTTMRLHAPRGRPVYGGREYGNLDPVDVDLETIAFGISDAREALAERNFKSVDSNVSRLLEQHGLPESARNALAYGVLEAHVKLLEEIERRILGRAPMVFTEEPSVPITVDARAPIAEGPLFSEALPAYVDLAVKDKGWRGQSTAQNEATFAMFKQVCGDLPVSSYTRRNTSDFYNTLRALPALYSKDKKWRELPLKDVVEAAKDDPATRLTMKTIARHFSALGGFFTHAKRHGLIEGDNPAHGFEFPRKGRANSKRKVWEGEKLRKLFLSPVWTGCHPTFRSRKGSHVIRDDKHWLPLLGLYHGNRLEEFAQLRREDVKREGKFWYLQIHGEDGRQIKNEQSARRVPIHPEIERLGFLEYVNEVATKPTEMVFPLLKPGGPDGKVGYYFTKWWTNYRKSIGVYEPGLDYHSFRHGVTTKLFAVGVARDVVDELTGHEGEGTSQRVYRHDAPLSVLRDAIEKVRWPEVENL